MKFNSFSKWYSIKSILDRFSSACPCYWAEKSEGFFSNMPLFALRNLFYISRMLFLVAYSFYLLVFINPFSIQKSVFQCWTLIFSCCLSFVSLKITWKCLRNKIFFGITSCLRWTHFPYLFSIAFLLDWLIPEVLYFKLEWNSRGENFRTFIKLST